MLKRVKHNPSQLEVRDFTGAPQPGQSVLVNPEKRSRLALRQQRRPSVVCLAETRCIDLLGTRRHKQSLAEVKCPFNPHGDWGVI